MKMGFGLFTTFIAHPGQQKALAEILLESASALEKEASCLSYIVGISEQDENIVYVTEIWTDEGHHRAALENPATKAAIERAMPLIANVERNKELDIIGGKGL